jgi:hypothetical protein
MVSTIDPERMVTRGDDNYGFAFRSGSVRSRFVLG